MKALPEQINLLAKTLILERRCSGNVWNAHQKYLKKFARTIANVHDKLKSTEHHQNKCKTNYIRQYNTN